MQLDISKKAAKQGIIILSEVGGSKWMELTSTWHLPVTDESSAKALPKHALSERHAHTTTANPSIFGELIQLLRNQPDHRVALTQARAALKKLEPSICARAGCKKLKSYFKLAKNSGLFTFLEQVTVDGTYQRYVQLNPPFDTLITTSTPPELAMVPSQTPTTNYNVPNFIPNALDFGPQTKQAEGLPCSLDDSSIASYSLTTSMQDELRDDQIIPPTGLTLLIEILQEMRDNGVPRPYQSTVHAHIIDQKPAIYEEAGVQSFTEYFNLAKDMEIVELGGVGVRQYISLLS